MQIQNVLVVCIGNICRSPMAEYFLKNNHPNLNIESAGLSAMLGIRQMQKLFTVWIS